MFLVIIFIYCNFGPNCFEGPCLFLSFCSDTLYVLVFVFNKGNFWHLIKFCQNFSLGSSLNQSQTYRGNPCGVYPDLSSPSRNSVIQNSITCIKRSAPSKDHIIWYQGFDSCYRFYPIQFCFLFIICLRFVFYSLICVLVCILLHFCLHLVVFLFTSCLCPCFCFCLCSCYILVIVLVLVSFRFYVKKKMFEFYYKFCLGTIWVTARSLGV